MEDDTIVKQQIEPKKDISQNLKWQKTVFRQLDAALVNYWRVRR